MVGRLTTDKIIVHCTATPEGREVTLQEIDRWHKQALDTTTSYTSTVRSKRAETSVLLGLTRSGRTTALSAFVTSVDATLI